MIRAFIINLGFILAACSATTVDTSNSNAPQSIVSLDYCADQYVLKMVERENIAALSPDASKAFSYMRETAKGLPTVRPHAEDVLKLNPDIVVRSYGGGPNAQAFFERAGIEVVNIGWANDIDSIKHITQDIATKLGNETLGQSMSADIDARLAGLPQNQSPQTSLYMTPSGVTSGSGSLVHEMLIFHTTPGWQSLPLERLAHEKPDMIAAAFFDTKSQNKDHWSAMRHPIAQSQLKAVSTVKLDGSWTSCGAWYLLDAIEALAWGAVK